MKTVRRKMYKKLAADGSGRRWDFLDRHRIWYINLYFFRINFGLDQPPDFIAERDCYKQIEIRTNHELHSLGFA